MFADVSATDVIACAAGTSPAVTAAAISFSNPSKECKLLQPYHLARYKILCSVQPLLLREQSRNQKTLEVMFDQDHKPIDWLSQSFTKSYLHSCKFTCSSFGSIILSVSVIVDCGSKSQDADCTIAVVANFLNYFFKSNVCLYC